SEGQAIDLRHEQAEAVLLDEVVQLGQVGFSKGGRYVHRRASRSKVVVSPSGVRHTAFADGSCRVHPDRIPPADRQAVAPSRGSWRRGVSAAAKGTWQSSLDEHERPFADQEAGISGPVGEATLHDQGFGS